MARLPAPLASSPDGDAVAHARTCSGAADGARENGAGGGCGAALPASRLPAEAGSGGGGFGDGSFPGMLLRWRSRSRALSRRESPGPSPRWCRVAWCPGLASVPSTRHVPVFGRRLQARHVPAGNREAELGPVGSSPRACQQRRLRAVLPAPCRYGSCFQCSEHFNH